MFFNFQQLLAEPVSKKAAKKKKKKAEKAAADAATQDVAALASET